MRAENRGRGRKREGFMREGQEAEGGRRGLGGKMGRFDDEGGEGGGSRHGKSRELFSALFLGGKEERDSLFG